MAESDEYFMKEALKEAKKGYEAEEVPIGAILVIKDKIIARAFNQVERLNDSTAHAEILALTSAFSSLGSKYLPAATLYVTIEPCMMCAGALYWSKIGKVVYGAADQKHGAFSLSPHEKILHPKTILIQNICGDECAAMIKSFFATKR